MKNQNIKNLNNLKKDTKSGKVKKPLNPIGEHKEIFKKFTKWCVIPNEHKRMDPEKIADLGIEDPEWLELIAIKNHAEFAEKFGVWPQTLSAWRKEIDPHEEDLEMHKYFNLQTKEYLNAYIKTQKIAPTSDGLKAWYGLIKEKGIDAGPTKLKVDLSEEAKEDLLNMIKRSRR